MRMYNRLILVSYVTLLLACPSMAQVAQDGKRELSEDDYGLWGTMRTEGISGDGKWVSYSNSFEDAADTLFVRQADGQNTYNFSGCSRGRFIGKDNFACINSNNEMHLLQLSSGRQTTMAPASDLKVAADGQVLITAFSTSKSFQLKLWEVGGRLLKAVDNVTAYSLSPKGKVLIYTYKDDMVHRVKRISLINNMKEVTLPVTGAFDFSHFEWQPDGQAVAFLQKADDTPDTYSHLHHYRLSDAVLKTFDPSGVSGLQGKALTDIGRYRLQVSELGNFVFFGLRPQNIIKENDLVQVWNANDRELYPIEKQIMRWHNVPKLAVWSPDTGLCRMLSDTIFPHATIVSKGRFAVLAHPNATAPQFRLDNDKDYYIEEIATGERKLLLKSHPGEMAQFRESPNGRFIAYFSKGNWWAYDLITASHRQLTGDREIKWESSYLEYTLELGPYGSPGWTTDSKSLVVYDASDIWLLPLTGNPVRLTDGREKKIRFRIARDTGAELYGDSDHNRSTGIVLSEKTLLEAKGYDGATGYFRLKRNFGTYPIAYGGSCIEQVRKAAGSEALLYTEQRFDLSPRVMLLRKGKVSVIAQSNPQQSKFFWGKSEMVYYCNSYGEPLRAALYYPAAYRPGKKYPMIVNIYESLSKDLHRYVNPTVNSPEGINITRLTSKGYFVLMPDMAYRQGEVGYSALDCTLSAVKAVLQKGMVEEGSVGLIGHSFGGYETDFIITQTGFFAAAVSGAAIPDVQGWYFNISESLGKEDMWRFEHQQFRMGKSFFAMKDSYLRNSALINAAGVTTPLLSWAGSDDKTVPVNQSLSFYLALRRLGKRHILLVYPGAGHSLGDVRQQQDLSQRILDWFGYYLKKEKAGDWIEKGTAP